MGKLRRARERRQAAGRRLSKMRVTLKLKLLATLRLERNFATKKIRLRALVATETRLREEIHQFKRSKVRLFNQLRLANLKAGHETKKLDLVTGKIAKMMKLLHRESEALVHKEAKLKSLLKNGKTTGVKIIQRNLRVLALKEGKAARRLREEKVAVQRLQRNFEVLKVQKMQIARSLELGRLKRRVLEVALHKLSRALAHKRHELREQKAREVTARAYARREEKATKLAVAKEARLMHSVKKIMKEGQLAGVKSALLKMSRQLHHEKTMEKELRMKEHLAMKLVARRSGEVKNIVSVYDRVLKIMKRLKRSAVRFGSKLRIERAKALQIFRELAKQGLTKRGRQLRGWGAMRAFKRQMEKENTRLEQERQTELAAESLARRKVQMASHAASTAIHLQRELEHMKRSTAKAAKVLRTVEIDASKRIAAEKRRIIAEARAAASSLHKMSYELR